VELQLGFVRQPEFPHGLNLKTQQGELKMKSTKKESKPKPEQQYVLHSDASAAKFNRGFLGAVVAFVEKKGTVDTPSLISQFSVRQFDGKKVSADRVRRYVAYCKAHGIFKVAVKASKAKKTSPVVKAAKTSLVSQAGCIDASHEQRAFVQVSGLRNISLLPGLDRVRSSGFSRPEVRV
jgi:hypothetical protein